ncbi:MAG: signal recognition particle protein [Dehalococcoidia bacterium]
MFEALTDKLTAAFNRLTSRGRLAEKDVDEALRQVRLALLEADVNFKVARDFVAKVRERAVGQDVLESLSPGQQVVKIVHEELTAVLSGDNHKLTRSSQSPTVLMLVGLQGSGKTTTAAKLASQLRRQGQTSLLIAADLRRPAAIEQLVALGKQMDIPVYSEDTSSTTVKVARAGIDRARELGMSWAIIDTGGRLHIDKEMMRELAEVHDRVSPHEVILVLDAMTGQDAVQAAEEFHRQVPLTGLIMTKLDGDARGGAALSVTRVTGIPIKFLGMGERTDALEPFHPDRLASRILGMGDVLTLVEKAQEVVDEKRAKELEKKLRKASFDLEDFLEQLQNLKRMGSIGQFMEMIPGFSQMSKRLPKGAFDEGELTKVEAIIHSMTPQERRNPDIINGSRRRRIALGSGTKPQDINQLINQFGQAQKMMRQMTQGRGPKNLANLFK